MTDLTIPVVMLLIGIFGGFISGMVGIGGSIIIYPAILLIPPLFGAPIYSAHIASGLTASQVFFSTLSGSIHARKESDFSLQLVLSMGIGMLLGSTMGAILANFFNESFVNTVYIILALLALILLFYKATPLVGHPNYNKILLFSVGVLIGIFSGIVGAGGAFIIIPVLLVFFKLSMNTVVTNSIVIAFLSSIGAFIVKLLQGYVPISAAIFLIIGSIIFAPIGFKVGKMIPNLIQKIIICVIIVIAIIQLI